MRVFASLRVRFVAVFILASIFAVGCFFLTRMVCNDYMSDVYLSSENKAKREAEYHESLQQYIDDEHITFENIDRVSEWQKKNLYVYLMIYKEQTDDEALFIPDDMVDKTPKPPVEPPADNPTDDTQAGDGNTPTDTPSDDSGDSDTPTGDDTTTGDGDTSTDDTQTGDGDTPTDTPSDSTGGGEDDPTQDDDVPDTDGGNDDSDKDGDSGSSSGGSSGEYPGGTIGGITVDLPTKSELQEAAKKLDMLFIELPENQYVYARFAEFTEYLYYDIINIASLVFSFIVMLVILLLYITRVTFRIGKLGATVNHVASGDSERKISINGKDEIAELADNVESMRSTMVENYKREKEALNSNTELITSMSHDIRTPLTVLLGYIDVMRQNSENNEQMQGYIKAAESTAMRLKKLSDDMFGYFLVFGRDEQKTVLEEYDALTIFEQMLAEHVLLMNENGYVTNLSIDDGLFGKSIRADAQGLVRIFDNVFSNMCKYADKSEPIEIEASVSDGSARVSFLNKIKRDVEAVESNGIGLKTCKKLAENMGARFGYSEGENTFVSELLFDLCEQGEPNK